MQQDVGPQAVSHSRIAEDQPDEQLRNDQRQQDQSRALRIVGEVRQREDERRCRVEPNEMTPEERKREWNRIFDTYSDRTTDWSGLEMAKDFLWQKQLHLYEVPFYYVEYGMAQLGAIAIWRNFRTDPKKALEGYQNALRLGYLRTIPEIYKAANIKFDFSREYIKELMAFVRKQL